MENEAKEIRLPLLTRQKFLMKIDSSFGNDRYLEGIIFQG